MIPKKFHQIKAIKVILDSENIGIVCLPSGNRYVYTEKIEHVLGVFGKIKATVKVGVYNTTTYNFKINSLNYTVFIKEKEPYP